MRMMYIVEAEQAIDTEGREIEFREYKEAVETIEQAEEIAKTLTDRFPFTGSWEIVEKAFIEEMGLTVKGRTVKSFDYWKEVGRFAHANKMIKCWTENLEELEDRLTRCKTERSIKITKKQIEEAKRFIAKFEDMKK